MFDNKLFDNKSLDRIKEKKEWIICGIMAAVIFAFGICQILEIGQPVIFDDELGYWANSSFFLGQDWRSIAGNIRYYSYGYSLLLVPVRLLAGGLGWNWRQMYEAVVIMQGMMLAAGFLLAVRLCKRYLTDFHWLARDAACFTAMLYPTYIVYAHIAWTETLLAFLVWLFLYLMMRLTDQPTARNHLCFALLSFYMYAVHQRCLAAVVAAIIIVLYMRFLKENKFSQTAVFFGTLYLCYLIHTMVKKKLQNDFYLAQEPAGWKETFGYAMNKNAFITLALVAACLAGLYLLEKGRVRLTCCLAILSVLAVCVYFKLNIGQIQASADSVANRLAVNDFAGQLNKALGIFSAGGLRRLMVSVAGKWFYLASATGLIICFGIWDLGKHALLMMADSAKMLWNSICNKANQAYQGDKLQGHKKESVWFFGAFLLWLGIFAVNVVYIMDMNRSVDVVYGRYHEIAAVFLALYGFYCLMKDGKWLPHLLLFAGLYLLAGRLCQNLLDGLGSTSFELCHSVMMGRVLLDGEAMDGKIWEMARYSLSVGALICILVKARVKRFPKAALCQTLAALMVGACIWAHIGTATVRDYVISINHSQQKELPDIVAWIDRLSQGETVYFLKDTRYYRWGLALQYYLFDREMVMDNYSNIPHGADKGKEDAFYVTGVAFGRDEEILKEYAAIADTGSFTLLAPRGGGIHQRMLEYKDEYEYEALP